MFFLVTNDVQSGLNLFCLIWVRRFISPTFILSSKIRNAMN
jgi:hypothetical protein